MQITIKSIEMPLIGATKDDIDPKAVAHFVHPEFGDWFVIEGEPLDNGDIMFFGYARLLDEEYGTFTLAQLLMAGAVLDDEFKPKRMSKVKSEPRSIEQLYRLHFGYEVGV